MQLMQSPTSPLSLLAPLPAHLPGFTQGQLLRGGYSAPDIIGAATACDLHRLRAAGIRWVRARAWCTYPAHCYLGHGPQQQG
jgi:hypothetical protein